MSDTAESTGVGNTELKTDSRSAVAVATTDATSEVICETTLPTGFWASDVASTLCGWLVGKTELTTEPTSAVTDATTDAASEVSCETTLSTGPWPLEEVSVDCGVEVLIPVSASEATLEMTEATSEVSEDTTDWTGATAEDKAEERPDTKLPTMP